MGLQVRNGWKLSDGAHPAEVAQLIRRTLKPLIHRQVAEFVVEAAVWSIDKVQLGKQPPAADDHPLILANDEARRMWEEHGTFDCQVVLLCDLEGDGAWYAIGPHSDPEGCVAALDALEVWEDFHYTSTIDEGTGPHGQLIGREQWSARGEVWNRITTHGPVSEDGLVVQLLPGGPPYMGDPAELVGLIPDRTTRARKLVTEQLVRARTGPTASASEVVGTLSWMRRTPGVAERIDALAAQVADQLVDLGGRRLWGTTSEILAEEGCP